MTAKVYVAGTGVISAIGINASACLHSLENELAGIGAVRYLDTVHGAKIPVAEVRYSNEELSAMAGLPPQWSRTAMLSSIAAREALESAAIPDLYRWRTGFISANTVGGMDKTESFFPPFLGAHEKGRLRDVMHHECGTVTELVADHLGIKDYLTTISTACSSSANAVFFGGRLIKHNMLDVVVAGGTDALTKFTLNGFNTLMILDHQYCKPFDEHRKGLNLGEGAGYLVLVSERVAATLKMMPYCTLSGYCNSNDAYHQTASSPEGIGSKMAMQGALDKSGLQPSDIDYINLHGTGTQNNDQSEGTAIRTLFGPHYPKMSSTKSFTGHTLGACGGIEAVFSALAIRDGIVYPSLRLDTPMMDFPFVPETVFRKGLDIRNVLSNSFGFGGNCTSLVLSKN